MLKTFGRFLSYLWPADLIKLLGCIRYLSVIMCTNLFDKN